jgi:hypothetical protein
MTELDMSLYPLTARLEVAYTMAPNDVDKKAIREAIDIIKPFDNWLPTADNINALPPKLKDYVCHIETLCDPQYIIQENCMLRDENENLRILVKSLK